MSHFREVMVSQFETPRSHETPFLETRCTEKSNCNKVLLQQFRVPKDSLFCQFRRDHEHKLSKLLTRRA